MCAHADAHKKAAITTKLKKGVWNQLSWAQRLQLLGGKPVQPSELPASYPSHGTLNQPQQQAGNSERGVHGGKEGLIVRGHVDPRFNGVYERWPQQLQPGIRPAQPLINEQPFFILPVNTAGADHANSNADDSTGTERIIYFSQARLTWNLDTVVETEARHVTLQRLGLDQADLRDSMHVARFALERYKMAADMEQHRGGWIKSDVYGQLPEGPRSWRGVAGLEPGYADGAVDAQSQMLTQATNDYKGAQAAWTKITDQCAGKTGQGASLAPAFLHQ